jgi:TolA-binding protein
MMAEIADMYGASDDEAIVTAEIKRPVIKQGMITEFEVNGQRIRTIDPTYVTLLENRLAQAEQVIQELRNEINRINNGMRTRRAETAQLQRQIDGKIDRQ